MPEIADMLRTWGDYILHGRSDDPNSELRVGQTVRFFQEQDEEQNFYTNFSFDDATIKTYKSKMLGQGQIPAQNYVQIQGGSSSQNVLIGIKQYQQQGRTLQCGSGTTCISTSQSFCQDSYAGWAQYNSIQLIGLRYQKVCSHHRSKYMNR
eukprot:TRINITY_DN31472_c0_g1_i1.p2 TRINITY_DN31472_c0_g1~~TRINITY_DN31472_c0_g1_i1.p2  ORF type:complete len:151 (-),score=11.70 TRINITY_DN31472_c0_g1_i1:347-799(-)